jgi:hypothetical protein
MKPLNTQRFSKERRNLLKTMAAAGVTPALFNASSLVGSMMFARSAQAQSGASKSLILLGCGGSIDEKWRPRSDFSLPSMSAPYEDVKDEMNFIVGGSMSGGGHGIMFHRFNDASWSKDSFEVNMGRTIGENHSLKYLNLGVQSGNGLSRQGSTAVPTINDPETALSQIFAGSSNSTSSGRDPKLSIVDAHKEAMDALKVKLGHHEKNKLDNHLTAIEEFEKKFSSSNSTSSSCGAPPSTETDGSFDREAEIQTEIAILALQCGVTASVSLAFGNDSQEFIMRDGKTAHSSHHCCSSSLEYELDIAYMSGIVARVIRRMKQEGLLDSTVVSHLSDFGDARAHANSNVPLFMAGAGIKGGQVTQVSASTTQTSMFQTTARLLGADQHANFRDWGNSGIDAVLI